MSRIRAKPILPQDRLIFALDVPDFERAASLIDTLGDAVTFYKVGLELILSRDFVRVMDRLHERGKNVFVDGKLYDVPQTVEAAVRQLTVAGARFTSVHGTGPLLEAACRVRDDAGGDLRFRAGVDHIVVGRPIRDAPDPRAAAEEIQTTIRTLFPGDHG